MKRFKVFGLMFAAVLVAGVSIVGSASALLPTLLPSGTTASPLIGDAAAGAGKLVTAGGAIEIKCTKVAATLTINSPQLGTSKLVFTGCTGPLGGKCETGATAGEIVINGPAHLVFDVLGASLGAAVLLVIPATTITCLEPVIGNQTIVVKGAALGLVKPINTASKSLKVEFLQSGGKETERTYWNDSGNTVLTSLLSNLNGGTFEEAGDESEPATVTFLKPAGTIVTATVDA